MGDIAIPKYAIPTISPAAVVRAVSMVEKEVESKTHDETDTATMRFMMTVTSKMDVTISCEKGIIQRIPAPSGGLRFPAVPADDWGFSLCASVQVLMHPKS